MLSPFVSPHTWSSAKYETDVVISISQEETMVRKASPTRLMPDPYCQPCIVKGISLSSGLSMTSAPPTAVSLPPMTLWNRTVSYFLRFSCTLFLRLNTKDHFLWPVSVSIHQNSGPKSLSLRQVKHPITSETQMVSSQPSWLDMISLAFSGPGIRNQLFANCNMSIKFHTFWCL